MQVITLGTGNPIPSPDRAGRHPHCEPAGATCSSTAGARAHAGRRRRDRSDAVPHGVPHPFATTTISDLSDVITMRWVMTPNRRRCGSSAPGTRRLVDLTLAMLAEDTGYPHGPPRDPRLRAPGRGGRVTTASSPTGRRAHHLRPHRALPVKPTVGFSRIGPTTGRVHRRRHHPAGPRSSLPGRRPVRADGRGGHRRQRSRRPASRTS